MAQYDVFIIMYDKQPYMVLNDFGTMLYPDSRDVLDWYAEVYAMDRNRLTGIWVQKIDVSKIKFEEFRKAKP